MRDDEEVHITKGVIDMVIDMTMSLDGFVAGRNDGKDDHQLHQHVLDRGGHSVYMGDWFDRPGTHGFSRTIHPGMGGEVLAKERAGYGQMTSECDEASHG